MQAELTKQYQLCQSHSDKLVILQVGQEAGFKSVIERLDRINGRLDKHDGQILNLEQRKGAEESFFVANDREHESLDEWRDSVDKRLSELKESLAAFTGGKKVVIFFSTVIIALLGTIASLSYQSLVLRADITHIEETVQELGQIKNK